MLIQITKQGGELTPIAAFKIDYYRNEKVCANWLYKYLNVYGLNSFSKRNRAGKILCFQGNFLPVESTDQQKDMLCGRGLMGCIPFLCPLP